MAYTLYILQSNIWNSVNTHQNTRISNSTTTLISFAPKSNAKTCPPQEARTIFRIQLNNPQKSKKSHPQIQPIHQIQRACLSACKSNAKENFAARKKETKLVEGIPPTAMRAAANYNDLVEPRYLDSRFSKDPWRSDT